MAVTRSAMNGWYKTRYGQKNDLLPEWATLQQDFPFQMSAKTGDSFKEPVRLRQAHGVTIKGTADIGTLYDLNDPISAQWKELSIQGSEIILRDQIAYGAIAAAMGGNTSYGEVVDETVVGLDQSARFYTEAAMLYGQTSIAEIESVSGSGTSRTWVITKKSWAPGLWAQGEGMKVDALTAPGGTQRNANEPVVVGAVDSDARSIAVTGDSTDLSAVVAGDVLVFVLADGALFAGIDKSITNTTTLHGIDASAYSLWKGNVHSAADSALTMGILHAGTVKARVKGLRGAIKWYVNSYAWQGLVDNESALRRYSESTKTEYEQGAASISFRSGNGKMEIVEHPMTKAGEAFGLELDGGWKRGGESDLVDQLAGDGNFLHELPGKNGVEIRNFQSQFFLCRRPSRQVKITNIVPNGLA